ncbi:MAG TPA: lipid II flippase MurJ [Ferruginibacter sp.]|nr:lipid II flippase MurJ [Ferruginibacter sp.]
MLKSESYKRGVVLSTIFNVVAKGVSFLNTLIITFYFGANAGTDIYFYILAVALLITGTINSIDYFVLVPESMKIREKNGEHEAQRFLNFFIYSYILFGILLAVIGFVSPVFFFTLFSKYDVAVLSSHYNLLYLGSLIIVFQLANNLLSAILTSYKFFTASIISALINSVFSILFTVFFHERLGITGTLAGIVIGYFVNFLILLYTLRRFQKWDFYAVRFLKDKVVWKNIGLMLANILPVWFRNFLTIYFLTGMGTGIITSFNLAQTLAALPEVFILTQVVSVTGIKFSELAARKDVEKTNELLINILNTLFIILAPVALVMAIANQEIIQIVFERGTFQRNSIATTAFCFFFFSLLLPSKIFDTLFSRIFTSFQLYGISTAVAIVAHSLITTLIFFFTTYFSLQGYFLAMLAGYYIIVPVAFMFIVRVRIPGIKMNRIIKDILLLLMTAAAVYFLADYLYGILAVNTFSKITLLCFIVFIPFLLLANWLLDLKFQKDIILSIFAKK